MVAGRNQRRERGAYVSDAWNFREKTKLYIQYIGLGNRSNRRIA